MFRVRNLREVILFATCVTLVAITASWMLSFFIFPFGMYRMLFWSIALITMGTAFPICLFVGHTMMQNWRLHQQLERIAHTDRLTNVATRDRFFAQVADPPGQHGTLLMMDIDFFKQVNDTYGHLVGDQVIAHVAAILSAETRKGDVLCRFGGEEFLMFLQDTDPASAHDIAERIRCRIEAAAVDTEDHSLSVTISIGGALAQAAREIEQAIKHADDALYSAKSLGRNRVVIAAA